MAHALEINNGRASMFYVKETPWHGLGQKVSEDISIVEGIKAAGLDWNVELHDMITVPTPADTDADEERDAEATGRGLVVKDKAMVRSDKRIVLGTVGPRYTPLQNRAAFDFFQPYLDAKECHLHTAGSLHEGRKIWVLAKINRDNMRIVKNDEVAKFVLLSNSHDGTTSIRVGYTPIRVVCANTMAQAHQRGTSSLIRIRHTRSSKSNLDQVRDTMNLIDQTFEATAEQYRFLASRNFNQADIKAYVRTMLDVADKQEEDVSTRTKNIMEDIMERIEGPMQSMEGVRGTWWAAYNGVNERLNYETGRNASNRMDSLWFGANATLNDRALSTALEFANAV